MALWQGRSKRKPTGGRIKLSRGKRKFEIGREKQFTVIDERKVKSVRTMGGNQKIRLLSTDVAYVLNPKNKKITKTTILSVRQNPANKNYIQRNILTKGATIQTEMGLAKITSRPGQIGTVNAILVEE